CTERDMRRVQVMAEAKNKGVWLTEAGFNGRPDLGDSEAEHTRSVAGYIDEMVDNVDNNGCNWGVYTSGDPRRIAGDAYWEKTFHFHLHVADNTDTPLTHLGDFTPGSPYQPRESYDCLEWYANGSVGSPP